MRLPTLSQVNSLSEKRPRFKPPLPGVFLKTAFPDKRGPLTYVPFSWSSAVSVLYFFHTYRLAKGINSRLTFSTQTKTPP